MSRNSDNGFKLELLQYSYWEHFKFMKDLSFVLPVDHPKRVLLMECVNDIQSEIHELQNAEEESKEVVETT